MMIFSDVFFSYRNFPEWSHEAIRLLPLTALTERSVFNEGAGWAEIAVPALALTLLGVACFSLALKLFKWY